MSRNGSRSRNSPVRTLALRDETSVHLSKTENRLLRDVDEIWPQKVSESETLMKSMLPLLVSVNEHTHVGQTSIYARHVMFFCDRWQARVHEAYLDIKVAKELGLQLTRLLGEANQVRP